MNPVPSTVVKLLSNIPWDNKYTDVRVFARLNEQTAYFNSKVQYTFTNFTYQRYNPNLGQISAIRIPILADKLYRCNYLMFQNAAHGDKWFYAFIKELNYINENVTEIIYELDIMQTWRFDYRIMECFVEREHTINDSIGYNRIPENLELGDYVYYNFESPIEFEPAYMYYCAVAPFDKDMKPSTGGIYAGTYSGLAINIFANIGELEAFISRADSAGLSESIVSIFPFPSAYISEPEDNYLPVYSAFLRKKHYNDIDGYVPRNKKLFNYPFNFLLVTNNAGNSAEFKWEFFERDPSPVYIIGALSPNPQFIAAPADYKAHIPKTNMNAYNINYNEAITLETFPQCAFTSDVYKVYLAQNSTQLTTYAATEGIRAVANIANFDLGGLANQAANVAQKVAKITDMQALPKQVKGNHTGGTTFSAGLSSFYFYDCCITYKYAAIIDEYFDMYGYATNRVKKPNLFGRKSWNYVKCINAQIKGNIPADDLSRIVQIFNDGCTFWHTDDVGNYSLDNSIGV